MARTLLREPLVHFFIIGVALFTLDALRVSDEEKSRQIVVGPQVYELISDAFVEGRGRKPTPQELQPLVDTWVSNEILYREAKAMQLDQGDDMIRERVIQKVRAMIAGQVDVSSPTDEDLRDFFVAHKSNYDQPTLYDFTFVRLDAPKADVEAQIAEWIKEQTADLSEAGARVLRFRGRSKDNLSALLGDDTARQVAALKVGDWTSVAGPKNWAAVRVDRIQPAQEATFDLVKADVRKRWAEWAAQRQGAAQIAEMRKSYTVKYDDMPEHAASLMAAQAADQSGQSENM